MKENDKNKQCIDALNTAINFSRTARGQHIKTDICEITIYFLQFPIMENVMYHFYEMLMDVMYLFLFSIRPLFQDLK